MKPGEQGWIEFDGTLTAVVVIARAAGTRLKVKTLATGGVLIVEGHHVRGAKHRHGDPDTAVAAAQAQTEERVTANQWKVLWALYDAGAAGLVDDAHFQINKLIATSAGKRRLELQRMGLVESTGQKGKTGQHSDAIRWRLTDEGRKTYHRLLAAGLPRQGEVA